MLGSAGFELLVPVFYNTSITRLFIGKSTCIGMNTQRGGEAVRDLLAGNRTLQVFQIYVTRLEPMAMRAWLQILGLSNCQLTNECLAKLLLSMGDSAILHALESLDLSCNAIGNADGGHQVTLLLQRCPSLRELILNGNRHLGPLDAETLAPGLAAATHLNILNIHYCGLGNRGVSHFFAADGGQPLSSWPLTFLDIEGNDINDQEIVVALVSRCTNLEDFRCENLTEDQQRRVELLLDRKRLCTEARALAGSPFSILFRVVEEAHGHEHGLSAIFIILQNDGDDCFYNAYKACD